jgi:hypothetical protein
MPVRVVERWILVILDIMVRADIRYSELQSGFLGLVWGGWLLFGRRFFPGSDTFTAFYGHVVSSWVLGMVFLAVGLVQLWALVSRKPAVRYYCSWAVFGLWCFVAIITCRVNPKAVMAPTAISFSLSAFWAMLRMAGERTCV